jgi:Protein of unknown function (DUF3421)
MKSFDRLYPLFLSAALSCCGISAVAQNGSMLGQSIRWNRVQSPFSPDQSNGAIAGGPGSDPNPGTPMFICRAQVQGSVVPGKWVQGNCNVAYGGSEQIVRSYEVAYGSARWGPYQGSFYGLAQTGSNADGSPLYSCRVRYSASGTDYGYQPGDMVSDGTCHIPFGGGEVVQSPPFDVLYATGGGRPPIPYPPYPYPAPYPIQPVQPAQPYPSCRANDPLVKREIQGGTSWYVGPRCSPTDAFGNVQPKYPQPGDDAPPPPYDPGPSSVTWQPAQSPFVPGDNAIKGGPGNGPKPNSPLYVCRVSDNNALLPGKWVDGECRYVNDAGKEDSAKTYEVAIGPAEWRNFDGNIGALVPGGYLVEGTHLYICRKQISVFGNKGYQPGFLVNGRCHIPYGVDNDEGPPFDALYNVFSAPPEAAQPQPEQGAPPPVAAGPGPAQQHGILISFMTGTAATDGTVTVTNGSTNDKVTKPLPANSTPRQCMEIVQQAAFQAGLQIQAQSDGGLRIFGTNNAVDVTQASLSVRQF